MIPVLISPIHLQVNLCYADFYITSKVNAQYKVNSAKVILPDDSMKTGILLFLKKSKKLSIEKELPFPKFLALLLFHPLVKQEATTWRTPRYSSSAKASRMKGYKDVPGAKSQPVWPESFVECKEALTFPCLGMRKSSF